LIDFSDKEKSASGWQIKKTEKDEYQLEDNWSINFFNELFLFKNGMELTLYAIFYTLNKVTSLFYFFLPVYLDSIQL
jgi:hypothetical protein